MSTEKTNNDSQDLTAEKPDWHPFSVWKKQIHSNQIPPNGIDLNGSTEMSGSWKIPSELSQGEA